MTLLKQYKPGQILVTKLSWLIEIIHIFIVIKAEHVPYDNMGTTYMFPDKDDNLTDYTGGNAQVLVPNGLLQSIGKYNAI